MFKLSHNIHKALVLARFSKHNSFKTQLGHELTSFSHANDTKGREWRMNFLLPLLSSTFYCRSWALFWDKAAHPPSRVIIRPNRAKRRRNKAKVTRAAGNFSWQILCWDTRRLANSLSPISRNTPNFTFKLGEGGLWKMRTNLHPVSRPAILLGGDRKLALGPGDLLLVPYVTSLEKNEAMCCKSKGVLSTLGDAVNFTASTIETNCYSWAKTRTKNCSRSLTEKSTNASEREDYKWHLYGPAFQPYCF